MAKDRDLGQTFTVPAGPARRLRAITLRVGAAPYQGSIDGARGASTVLQILAVSGTPIIHDNGTTGTTTVSVSYPDQALADDYITGETYTHMGAARGGLLPQSMRISAKNMVFPTAESTGTLLRFQLPESLVIMLEPTGRYAFLVGFESPAPGRSLPLDNWDFLNQKNATDAQRKQGPYPGGHAIRREGRIEHPHLRVPEVLELDSKNDSPDPTASTFLPLLEDRLDQEPGTWGRPDVDTYRDLVFWLEAEPIPDPKAASRLDSPDDSD